MTNLPTLSAHFLGTFRITIDGTPVDTVSSRRTRNLLAYLLVHRRSPVPRDVLMEAFWPHAAPDAARNSLHVALSGARHVLRAATARAVIERRFDTYQIVKSIAVWTDVDEFENVCRAGRQADRVADHATAIHAYEAACQLYEGDFLAEEPYAEWTASIRDGLRLDAIAVHTRLVELYIERTEYGPAALLGRRILAMDPCNEQVHRRLMTCYARAGLRHLALAQYHRMATELRDAFQARPSTESWALYQTLRQPVAAGLRSA